MNKFEPFVLDKVTIWCSSGRKFEGLLLNCEGDYVTINDRKDGRKLIAKSNIETVTPHEPTDDLESIFGVRLKKQQLKQLRVIFSESQTDISVLLPSLKKTIDLLKEKGIKLDSLNSLTSNSEVFAEILMSELNPNTLNGKQSKPNHSTATAVGKKEEVRE